MSSPKTETSFEPQRCFWCDSSDLYRHYHDTEWGFPVQNDTRLFEKICLEGFQSGLSWITILRKREQFRAAFAGFGMEKVARFDSKDVERLLANAGIVRHRGKIEAVINNAQRAVDLARQEGSLAAYLGQFEPKPDHGAAPQTASTSAESVALSKALKQQGWKFVGPTTVYGENDPFYSLAHSRANFDAFQAAGGTGSFAPFMV